MATLAPARRETASALIARLLAVLDDHYGAERNYLRLLSHPGTRGPIVLWETDEGVAGPLFDLAAATSGSLASLGYVVERLEGSGMGPDPDEVTLAVANALEPYRVPARAWASA